MVAARAVIARVNDASGSADVTVVFCFRISRARTAMTARADRRRARPTPRAWGPRRPPPDPRAPAPCPPPSVSTSPIRRYDFSPRRRRSQTAREPYCSQANKTFRCLLGLRAGNQTVADLLGWVTRRWPRRADTSNPWRPRLIYTDTRYPDNRCHPTLRNLNSTLKVLRPDFCTLGYLYPVYAMKPTFVFTPEIWWIWDDISVLFIKN